MQGIINLIVFIKNNDKTIDKKTLPLGVLNNKQNKRNIYIVIIPAIIALLIICLLSIIIDFTDAVLYTTLIYILLISILTIISNKTENNKLIIFENDLDYQKMTETIYYYKFVILNNCIITS